MGNTFKAHIFKRRSVGPREEVVIKLFDTDDSPLDIGGAPEPSGQAVLAAFKGDYDPDADYEAGSLVRYEGGTWLAAVDAPSDSLPPGEAGELEAVAVVRQQNGTSAPGFILPRDTDVAIADLAHQSGYYLSGTSVYFRVPGTVGEMVTIAVTGTTGSTGGQVMHPYRPDGFDLMGAVNYTSPQTWAIPAGGYFGLEVLGTADSIRLTGEGGPQPAEGNSWVRFA